MTRDLFDRIFDREIKPVIDELDENNSEIEKNDLAQCKKNIYDKYCQLNTEYKSLIFGDESDKRLLDRHKVASTICGAFLAVPVFDKTVMIQRIKQTNMHMPLFSLC